MARAQGKDFSSYQPPVTASDLRGLAFAAARVSNWGGPAGLTMGIDPNFAHNWAAFAAHGLVRMAYWYLELAVGPNAQARRLVSAVEQQGLRRGDILVCDSEIAGANANQVTSAFCREAGRLAGSKAIIVVYTNQNVGRTLRSCVHWPLWLAWPSSVPPGPAQYTPWPDWTFWQSGVVQGVDVDQFNGTAADLSAWVEKMTGGAPSPWEDDHMLLVNGQGAVTPIVPPPGAKKILFVADDGQQALPPAQLRVGAAQPWQLASPVTVSWSASPVEVALPSRPDKITVTRLDAGEVNVAYSFA